MYKTCNLVMLPSDEKAHFGDIILTPIFPQQLLVFEHQNCTEVAQHLYITSDEEIKMQDWFIDDKYKQPMKYFGEGSLLISSKKIILTTDQDLIKDGVQAIDDEFLQ